MINQTLNIFLIVSIALFTLGLYAVISRKNAIMILIGIELMINAALINFVAFGRLQASNEGQMMALFTVILAVAAACVGLSIIVVYFRNSKTINPKNL